MPPTATTDKPITDNQAEAAFVESFSAKLADGTVGVDRGRAKTDREAQEEKKDVVAPKAKESKESKGAPAAALDADTEADDTPADEITPDGSEADPDDPDAEKDDADTDINPDKDDAAADTDGKPDDDVDDEETPADVVDPVDDEETPEAELAKEARAELAKHGLKMTLDDLPKEARPMVKAKLDNMTAGYTRAMKEARAYRKDEAQYRASRSFDAQHPDLRIMELIEADRTARSLYEKEHGKAPEEPDLLDRVQARINESETETGRTALSVVTKDKRADALKGIEANAIEADRVLQRADEMTTYVQTACTKLNLPFEIVVAAVVNKLNEKPGDTRDLSEDEMDAVIGQQQRILAKHLGVKKVAQRKEEIQGRAKDRKTVSPAAKAGTGGAPVAPAGKKLPRNDAEFIQQFTSH